MGYKIVAVNPLIISFPLPSFGLANMTSLDDVKKVIFKKYKEMAEEKIDEDGVAAISGGGQQLNAAGRIIIFDEYKEVAEKAFEKFKKERWPKIEPALKLHLARQERRLAHFKVSCRLVSCDNPHRQKRGGGTGRKARRPAARPLFCGAHVGLRKLLTQDMLDALHASSERRVVIT